MGRTRFSLIFLVIILAVPLVGAVAIPDFPKSTVTVTGYWKFWDKDSNLRDLKYARVEVWDYNATTSHTLLGVAYTNSDGYYSITVTSTEVEGPDIYDKIFACNGHSVWVGASFNDTNTTYFYSTEDEVYWNIGGGTLNLGMRNIPYDDYRWAYYIYDLIADDAWNYLYYTVGWDNHYNLGVQWHLNNFGSSYYDNSVEGINVGHLDRRDPDVILHEYGHFVMHKIYTNYPTHDCTGHVWYLPFSEECGWKEGWPTYLQAAIQGDKFYEDMDNAYLIYSLEMPLHPSSQIELTGADVESVVAAALWDVFDSEVEVWDKLASGIQDAWEIVDIENPYTAIEFESDWLGSSSGSNCSLINIFDHLEIGNAVCIFLPFSRK
ncbi:MAG: hypothetical protein AB1894_04800 [Chloroflexota bacterium]